MYSFDPGMCSFKPCCQGFHQVYLLRTWTRTGLYIIWMAPSPQRNVAPIKETLHLWQDRSAGFLHPLTAELMETQKYQNFQTKFGRARGNFFFFLVASGEKIWAQWKGIIFFRWEPWKINERHAILFPEHKSPVRF